LVTSDISKRIVTGHANPIIYMVCYKPHTLQQPQTGICARTMDWPGKWKVCKTCQTQLHIHTASLSLLIHYTRRSVRTGARLSKKVMSLTA